MAGGRGAAPTPRGLGGQGQRRVGSLAAGVLRGENKDAGRKSTLTLERVRKRRLSQAQQEPVLIYAAPAHVERQVTGLRAARFSRQVPRRCVQNQNRAALHVPVCAEPSLRNKVRG